MSQADHEGSEIIWGIKLGFTPCRLELKLQAKSSSTLKAHYFI
jgi:hypothetical protein